MGARARALAILVGLMVTMASAALLLVSASGSVGGGPRGPAIRVAGSKAAGLAPFTGYVLVSAAGGFSAGEVSRVRDSTRVAAISAVRSGKLALARGGGRPNARPVDRPAALEAMAVDPDAYAAAVGAAGAKLAGQLARGPVLSRSTASLLRLRPGGRLRLSKGRSLRVAGVLDDRLLGGYDLALGLRRGEHLGVDRVAHLLLRPRGGADLLRNAVVGLLHGRTLRFSLPGQGPWPPGDDDRHRRRVGTSDRGSLP